MEIQVDSEGNETIILKWSWKFAPGALSALAQQYKNKDRKAFDNIFDLANDASTHVSKFSTEMLLKEVRRRCK